MNLVNDIFFRISVIREMLKDTEFVNEEVPNIETLNVFKKFMCIDSE